MNLVGWLSVNTHSRSVVWLFSVHTKIGMRWCRLKSASVRFGFCILNLPDSDAMTASSYPCILNTESDEKVWSDLECNLHKHEHPVLTFLSF